MNVQTLEQQRLAHRLSLDALAKEYEHRTPENAYQIEETLRRGIAFHQTHFGEVYEHPLSTSVSFELVRLSLDSTIWDGAVDG